MVRFCVIKNMIRMVIILVEFCIIGENIVCVLVKLGKIFFRNKIFVIKLFGDNIVKLIKVIIELVIINGKIKINVL